MSVPTIGSGTSLSTCSTIGGTYVPIGKITAFTLPKISVAKLAIECSDNGTFNGQPVSDFGPGWVDPGTFGCKILAIKAEMAVLRALVAMPYYFKFIKSDGSGFIAPGFISEMGEEIPLKEWMTADLTMVTTGAAIPTVNSVQT